MERTRGWVSHAPCQSVGNLLKLPLKKKQKPVPALPAYLIEPISQRFAALLPSSKLDRPLGCHRQRVPDREIFDRLV